MSEKCIFCNPRTQQVLMTGHHARILIPDRLHVLPEDGGHFIVSPLRHVRNRILLYEVEAVEIWRFSTYAAKLLRLLLNIDWYNFQENGNWTVNDPEKCHMHLHIYGRNMQSTKQPFGEALRFPMRKEIDDWDFGEYSENMVNQLRKYAKELYVNF